MLLGEHEGQRPWIGESQVVSSALKRFFRRNVLPSRLSYEECRAVLNTGCRELYVDLGDLQFIDSAGLAALLILYKESLARSFSLVLVDELGRQERLFAMTHLESIMPLQRQGPVATAAP